MVTRAGVHTFLMKLNHDAFQVYVQCVMHHRMEPFKQSLSYLTILQLLRL